MAKIQHLGIPHARTNCLPTMLSIQSIKPNSRGTIGSPRLPAPSLPEPRPPPRDPQGMPRAAWRVAMAISNLCRTLQLPGNLPSSIAAHLLGPNKNRSKSNKLEKILIKQKEKRFRLVRRLESMALGSKAFCENSPRTLGHRISANPAGLMKIELLAF